MEKLICKITSTTLGFESHGVFTAMLHVDYGVMTQGIGGFCLGFGQPGVNDVQPTKSASEFIIRVLRACGCARWERLPGTTIYALYERGFMLNTMPDGIENLPTEPGERFMFGSWQDRALYEQNVEKWLFGESPPPVYRDASGANKIDGGMWLRGWKSARSGR